MREEERDGEKKRGRERYRDIVREEERRGERGEMGRESEIKRGERVGGGRK